MIDRDVFRRWPVAFGLIGAAFVCTLLEVLLARYRYPEPSFGSYFVVAFWKILPSWLIPVALVPFMVRLARLAPVDGRTWRRTLPVHALAAVAFSIVHFGGTAAFRAWQGESFRTVFLDLFTRFGVADIFSYAAIAATLQAWRFQAELREREHGLTRARLQALHAQLRPHFLFNALHAISSMALNGERERVAQTVSRLSDLLRRSLDESAAQEVPLSSEMEVLDHYLEVERVRFEDRLQVERRIDPEALRALVPSLLLQPLVENAVRHGIERHRGPGRVVVEAVREGSRLRLEVRDTGPGFSANGAPHGNGIGLANTAVRLEQFYGAAQSLERGTAAEGGARVTIRMPFRTARETA